MTIIARRKAGMRNDNRTYVALAGKRANHLDEQFNVIPDGGWNWSEREAQVQLRGNSSWEPYIDPDLQVDEGL